jgi:hypothetical protein
MKRGWTERSCNFSPARVSRLLLENARNPPSAGKTTSLPSSNRTASTKFGQARMMQPTCLSMHQPWASLLVYGIKRIEGKVCAKCV